MLVKPTLYLLCLFIAFVSFIVMMYSIENKKKNVCKYIIILSIVYIVFLIIDIDFLVFYLDLSIGFEILIFRAIMFITIILFIISIIISKKKLKKLEFEEDSKKEKKYLLFLIIIPVIIVLFSYFREIYYINNSSLILEYSSPEEFGNDYAYAINDKYCKIISIGTDSNGYEMIKHLPKDFNEFNYSRIDDNVKINDNKIIIYEKNKIIYKGKINCNISNSELEEYFINEKKK